MTPESKVFFFAYSLLQEKAGLGGKENGCVCKTCSAAQANEGREGGVPPIAKLIIRTLSNTHSFPPFRQIIIFVCGLERDISNPSPLLLYSGLTRLISVRARYQRGQSRYRRRKLRANEISHGSRCSLDFVFDEINIDITAE